MLVTNSGFCLQDIIIMPLYTYGNFELYYVIMYAIRKKHFVKQKVLTGM